MPRPLHEAIRQADEIADWFEAEGPSPDNAIPASEYFLGLLGDVRDLGAEKVCGAVELAHRAGASWQQIGEVLGISRSAAERQFDPGVEQAQSRRQAVESPVQGL